MTPAMWIASCGMLATLLLNLAAYLIAWGAMKAEVGSLKTDVESLQQEAAGVGELRLQVARMEVKLEGLVEQIKDLNAALRWMRDPRPPSRAKAGA